MAGEPESVAAMPDEPADDPDVLMAAIAAGDRHAFQAFYKAVGPRLYAICLKMLRRREEADEVFQNAMVKVWAKAHLYDRAKGRAVAWSITVTRRCALDHLRAEGTRAAPLDEIDIDTLSMPMPEPQMAGPDLRRCLAELDKEHGRVIILAYIYGLSHGELESVLGRPLGTIKSWIRRGMARLKECLER